jgi:hypothetical protein
MILPFQTNNKERNTHTITDGLGGSISIPYQGSLSFNESDALLQLGAAYKNDDKVNYRTEAVAILLRYRFRKIVPAVMEMEDGIYKISNDELLTVNGDPISEPLLDNIYKFFINEKNGWMDDIQLFRIQGKHAKEAAIREADANCGVVIQRSDHETIDLFFVVHDDSQFIKENESIYEAFTKATLTLGTDTKELEELYTSLYKWNTIHDARTKLEKKELLEKVPSLTT